MINSRLVSVARASAEVTAGIPGCCAVSVRVLDDMTLRIHGGELLLVQAHEPFGQAMLLAALAGHEHSPRYRYIRAVRHAVPALRIRRAALHHEAVQEIVAGWQDATISAGPVDEVPVSRTLYLLRASRAGVLTRREAAEWQRWGRQAHERRDGIVIACPPTALARRPHLVRSAHEPAATYALGPEAPAVNTLNGGGPTASAIRLLELRAGRLHDLRTPREDTPFAAPTTAGPVRRPWSARDSGGAPSPNACGPFPTALPEP